ncbi:MAG: hypothetical protein SF123_19400 [Chloroflexota bacterium]|nr:hypothetical protein [Chloroflexota bacterium]
MSRRVSLYHLFLTVLALLIIVASRVPLMRSVEPEGDEINNLYLSIGTPADIIARTPYDWVPGGFLVMGAWQSLVGQHPFVLRWLPLLVFLLGCAFAYRLLLRWRGHDAALLGLLAYGALGLHIFMSIYMRGYSYPVALLPCALWLTARYFDHPRFGRALVLALVMVAMFYTQMTSAVAFAMLGLYTLLVYRVRVWRWWLPAMIALPLAVPEIVRQRSLLGGRLDSLSTISLPSLPEAYANLFTSYVGSATTVWVALLLLSLVLIALRDRLLRPRAWVLLVWALVMPVVLYLLNPLLGFFSGRYSWWVACGIALLIAWGLAHLPRVGRWGAMIALALLCFAPFDAGRYLVVRGPLLENYRWWVDYLRAGDVVVRDPANDCGEPEKWEMYTRVFFPQGLQFVSTPADADRVWFITFDGSQTPALFDTVQQGRVAGRFVGTPNCLFRLYEAPPDRAGISFENGMRFHGVEVIDAQDGLWTAPVLRREGESLRVRLWWSADGTMDRDYSVGLYLFDSSGAMVTQVDSAPQVTLPEAAPAETSRWQPQTLYIEERTLTIPYPAARGTYRLALAVYGWWDNVRLPAPGVGVDGTLTLLPVEVAAW